MLLKKLFYSFSLSVQFIVLKYTIFMFIVGMFFSGIISEHTKLQDIYLNCLVENKYSLILSHCESPSLWNVSLHIKLINHVLHIL